MARYSQSCLCRDSGLGLLVEPDKVVVLGKAGQLFPHPLDVADIVELVVDISLVLHDLLNDTKGFWFVRNGSKQVHALAVKQKCLEVRLVSIFAATLLVKSKSCVVDEDGTAKAVSFNRHLTRLGWIGKDKRLAVQDGGVLGGGGH